MSMETCTTVSGGTTRRVGRVGYGVTIGELTYGYGGGYNGDWEADTMEGKGWVKGHCRNLPQS